jgi:hypothetical protein
LELKETASFEMAVELEKEFIKNSALKKAIAALTPSWQRA